MKNGKGDGVLIASSNVAVTNNIITQNSRAGIRLSKMVEFMLKAQEEYLPELN